MSYMCTLLVRSLRGTDSDIAVSFFCGLQTINNDPLTGLGGLIRSLISHILSVHDFNLGFIDAEYEQQFQQYDVEYLASLFRTLVEQLPRNRVLFYIIDGISFYEKSKDMVEVDAVT
ncbi:hypothetical protein OEA41_005972 [Lepraria neglecta]|uniref:Nephrocystin 3-like N-terminal domain-containing protein n=1 Tax=Lepraria neglecta TaxID=209136 RepID=A0AAE0DMN5_9LECA|nr:hypothetical protein OEA41_005972 [Lepraria neglecta]